MTSIRETAVAGLFYPDNATVLGDWLATTLGSEAGTNKVETTIPRAIIVPHAGYIYSGDTAAKGFELWQGAQDKIRTVVVLGPAHRIGFRGVSTVDFSALATPLGELEVDCRLRDELLQRFDFLSIHNAAHAPEHSLEVELPFIKYLLPDVQVLPLLNGSVSVQDEIDLIRDLWRREGVYFVISSDLSHFLDYDNARKIDAETADLIEAREWQSLSAERACGYKGIQSVLAAREDRSLQVVRLQTLNSGDTAGDKSRVVGYGAWALYEKSHEVS
ncbi:AmmeMemoRadiSam system protein B [Thiomicrorhabdus xiamenensis]|uniref:MEMO1 family protein HQN79_06720 n=1 Tax=Thiomicrorhabdus xiamenensis TaxID=2739063 RepID=A0A7D4NYQ3_9GAMM|nr:AmmeMemoRadiSam system protein B [Thiomicrorhabdus xiamenensis]QKI89278.1 AmmeMemoRadiSam system protein B [Thiomicrorhabdus xiamenensis]